jgi:hypothetical protein
MKGGKESLTSFSKTRMSTILRGMQKESTFSLHTNETSSFLDK